MSAKRSGARKVKKKISGAISKESKTLLNLAKALKDYQRSQKRLTHALASARMGIWEATLKTGELWWSENVPALLRVKKKKLIKKTS